MKSFIFFLKLLFVSAITVTILYFWMLSSAYSPSAAIVYVYSIPFIFVVLIIISYLSWHFFRSWFWPLIINPFISIGIYLVLLNYKSSQHINDNYLNYSIIVDEDQYFLTLILRNGEKVQGEYFDIMKKEGGGNAGFDGGSYTFRNDTIFLKGEDTDFYIIETKQKIYDFPKKGNEFDLHSRE